MNEGGTTVTAIVALLVCSGDNKVSTKDAFTLFENNTGWVNGMSSVCERWMVTHLDQMAGHSCWRLRRRCGR